MVAKNRIKACDTSSDELESRAPTSSLVIEFKEVKIVDDNVFFLFSYLSYLVTKRLILGLVMTLRGIFLHSDFSRSTLIYS